MLTKLTRFFQVGAFANLSELLSQGSFKYLLIGVTSHAFTLWMEIVARNWLIWEMTGSVAAVGLVNFWRTIPILFLAVPAGVLADRVNRKIILLSTQIGILFVYLSILALLLMDILEIWHVYSLFFLRGVMIAFNQPPRQALIPSLVKEKDIGSAVAIQQFLFNGTRVISPIFTGLIFAFAGSALVFAIIVLFEIIVIIAWLNIKVPKDKTLDKPEKSAIKSTLEGLAYVKNNRSIVILLVLGFLSLLLLQPFMVVLPSLAGERFDIGPEGFGLLVSMMGAGSLIGPLILAFMGDFQGKGAMISVTMCLSGIALVALGLAPFLILAMGVLVLVGFFDSTQRTVTNGLLLTLSEARFHGRVISLYLLDRGFVPLGSLVAGYAAEFFGPAFALISMGTVLSISVLLVLLLQPKFLFVK